MSSPTRALGTTGLEVGPMGLGCMSMSAVYGPGDDAQGIETIHRALDLGVTLIDTADVYGATANEEGDRYPEMTMTMVNRNTRAS